MLKAAIAKIELPPGFLLKVRSFDGAYRGWGKGRAPDSYSVTFCTDMTYGPARYGDKVMSGEIDIATGSLENVYAVLKDYKAIRRVVGNAARTEKFSLRNAVRELELQRRETQMTRDTARLALRYLRERIAK